MRDGDHLSKTSFVLATNFNLDAVYNGIKKESPPCHFWNFHRCKQCPYRTKFDFMLRTHVKRHRVTRTSKKFNCMIDSLGKYKCGSCDYKTPLLINFKKHLEVSHRSIKTETNENQDNTFIFNDCDSTMNSVKNYSCNDCNFTTYSQLVHIKHLSKCRKEVVKESNPYEMSLQWHGYYKHLNKFGCVKCPFKTDSERVLNNHMKIKHSNGGYTCSDCSFNANTSMSLKNHVLSKHTPPEMIVWHCCSLCSFKTKWRANLYHHVNRQHMTKKYTCSECSFYSKQQRLLAAHVQVNHDKDKYEKITKPPNKIPRKNKRNIRFECAHCPFTSKVRVGIINHMEFKHPTVEKQWLKCEKCPYRSIWPGHLKRHMKYSHEESAKCTNCDFKAVVVATMEPQMKEHSNGWWLKCELCSFKSVGQSELREHILQLHIAQEKVVCFECQLCSYKTIEEKVLWEHVLEQHVVPQSADWFRCEMCPFKHKQQNEFKKHIFEKHIL